MTTAEKLRLLRKKKNISQDKLAQKLKISVSSIRNYENEKMNRIPVNNILKKFADYYKVSTEYLLNNDTEYFTTYEDIKINKILGLSNNAIKILKQSKKYKYNFNDFVKDFDLEKFLRKWSED